MSRETEAELAARLGRCDQCRNLLTDDLRKSDMIKAVIKRFPGAKVTGVRPHTRPKQAQRILCNQCREAGHSIYTAAESDDWQPIE